MDVGLNFRGDSTFVTDVAPSTYVLNSDLNLGDISRGNAIFALSATAGDIHFDNLNSGIDSRLSGRTYADPTKHGKVKIALSVYGVAYDVRLAIGDANNDQTAQRQIVKIYDGDPDSGGSLVSTIDKSTGPGAGQWYDAAGTLRTSAAAWVSSNTAVNHTFADDLYIQYGNVSAGYTLLAHIRVTTAVSGGGAPTLASMTPSSAYSNASVPVKLIGVGFVGTNLDGASGAFDTVSGLTFSNLNVSGPTAATADIQLATGLAPGTKNITFTTTGGTTAALTFTISDPGGSAGRVGSGNLRGGFVN